MGIISYLQSLGARHLFDLSPPSGDEIVTEGTEIIGSAGGTFANQSTVLNDRHSIVFCTFTTPSSFPTTNEEVIWEDGGAGIGAGLYIGTTGALNVYAGTSSLTPVASTAVLSASTQYSAIVEFRPDDAVNIHFQTGNSFSFWDYDRTPEATGPIGDGTFLGTDGGGYGVVNGDAGGNLNTVDPFTGTLDSPLYYTFPLQDYGNSSDPTFENFTEGGTIDFSFPSVSICEGVPRSLQSGNNIANGIRGLVLSNRGDINSSQGNGNNSSSTNDWNAGATCISFWTRQEFIYNPTCVYEQGGGTNNLAFMGGALPTWQAADAGQPFLIARANSLCQAQRPYHYLGIWEHHSFHAGSNNRILFYINGVLQEEVTDTITANFPGHGGNISLCNSGESLKSFNETSLASQTVQKNMALWCQFNLTNVTPEIAREMFERTTLADITITADTVANQQIALDALIGNTYENTNCAIRILQATDATNYRLFVDNITFNADDSIQDISIQFVGTGVLTVENTNGTFIKYTSAPPEVEQTTGTLVGGGSVFVIDNTKRVITDQTIVNSQDDKIVFDGSGTTYTIDGGIVTKLENVSGNAVTVTLTGGASTPTLIETSGSITVVRLTSFSLVGLQPNSEVRVYEAGTITEIDGVENSGTSFDTTISVSSVDLVIFNTQYQPIRITGIDTSVDVALPISQIFDRNYENP